MTCLLCFRVLTDASFSPRSRLGAHILQVYSSRYKKSFKKKNKMYIRDKIYQYWWIIEADSQLIDKTMSVCRPGAKEQNTSKC